MTDRPELRSPGGRYAVVGGGISGISAAAFLAADDSVEAVDLFEASAELGGVLQTEYFDDGLLELAADNFAVNTSHVQQLHETLGVDPPLLHPQQENRSAMVVHRGRPVAIPTGFSLLQPSNLQAVLGSSLFSWAGKIRIAAERFVPPNQDDGDESLESFALRRLGREAFERLIEPIVCGIFTARADSLSMQAAMPQFLKMEREHGSLIAAADQRRLSHGEASPSLAGDDSVRNATGARYDIFRAPANGMSRWIAEIVGSLSPKVTIKRRTPVDSIGSAESRWQIRSPRGEDVYDGIVIATPSSPTAKLVRPHDAMLAEALSGIPYASSVVVARKYSLSAVAARYRCFGIVIPQVENSPLLAVSFSSLKYSNRCQRDEVWLRIFLGGAVHPEVSSWSDQRLSAEVDSELHRLLGIDGQPQVSRVVRWPAAMPQYTLGHLSRVRQIEEACDRLGTLRVCGAAYRGVGIPQCIASGRAAAEAILRHAHTRQSVKAF